MSQNPEELMVEIGTEEEVSQAQSKFVKAPAGLKRGDKFYLHAQMQMPDWDNPGVSYKFPIVVTEKGDNLNKEAKLSTGIGKKGWKMIETLDNLSIKRVKNSTTGNISFNRAEVAGLDVIGEWIIEVGKNQETGNEFDMPKLNAIYSTKFQIPGKSKI
jgi:hypothetical protein